MSPFDQEGTITGSEIHVNVSIRPRRMIGLQKGSVVVNLIRYSNHCIMKEESERGQERDSSYMVGQWQH